MALVEDTLHRLEAALASLELVTTRRLEIEKGRGDLETELQIMQDDRSRLAVDLDGALARLDRVGTAATETNLRLVRAVATLKSLLGQKEGDEISHGQGLFPER
jgi:hypothetical protein